MPPTFLPGKGAERGQLSRCLWCPSLCPTEFAGPEGAGQAHTPSPRGQKRGRSSRRPSLAGARDTAPSVKGAERQEFPVAEKRSENIIFSLVGLEYSADRIERS